VRERRRRRRRKGKIDAYCGVMCGQEKNTPP